MSPRKSERGIGRLSRRSFLPTDPIPARVDTNACAPRPPTAAESAQSARDWRAEFLFDLDTLVEAPTCCAHCRAAWIESGAITGHASKPSDLR